MSEQNLYISRFCGLQNVLSQQRYWWLSFLFWLLLVLPGQAVELRIAIKDTPSQLKIGSSTTAIVKNSAGQKVGEIAAMSAFLAQPEGGGVALGNWRSGQLWVEPSGDGYIWIGDRWYRGAVHLVRNGNKLLAIDRVDLEEYLYSVVGAEAIPTWHLEALKAQAVAARTYALYKRAESKSNLYDLDTTTATQVYKGLESEYSSTHQAVNATAGEILTYNGQIILAVFHSSSGGHTENVEDIWSNPLPYLRGVLDYDQGAPVYQWTKSFSASELGEKLGGVGTVKAIAAERTTPRGRVVTMKVVGDRATKILSGSEIRQALGLRSTLFTVSSNGSNFQISGRGFGHGVGLSQWGAKNLAQQGLGYQQILSHYYQNTILAKLN
ncbi:MAG: SpoIID/LytB domain-containing protein [Oscillatoria sp. PMC 1051.18]|nr:SpoIID/LytB domain-containing protein [Oscillatoria sp. PMC 1050.18]MEC5030062.1 SpoIID/LytB domain-containing protein [Oscillatoria sp. PMC 1051.18]